MHVDGQSECRLIRPRRPWQDSQGPQHAQHRARTHCAACVLPTDSWRGSSPETDEQPWQLAYVCQAAHAPFGAAQQFHLCPYRACALPALKPASDGLSHKRKPSSGCTRASQSCGTEGCALPTTPRPRGSGGHRSWLGAQGTTVSHRAASWLTSIHLDSTVPASPGGAARHPFSKP